VEFSNGAIGHSLAVFESSLARDIWLIGEGYLIASFLDEQATDEFVVSVAPGFPSVY
jgi:dihydrofolate reductase